MGDAWLLYLNRGEFLNDKMYHTRYSLISGKPTKTLTGRLAMALQETFE